MYEKYGNMEKTVELYKHCCLSKNNFVKVESYKKLAYIYRKRKDFVKTIENLENVLKFSIEPNIEAMIDLAIQYEHRIKEFDKAISVVK